VKSKIIIGLFFVLLFNACVSPRPAMKEFTLDTNISVTPNAVSSCLEKNIQLSKPYSDESLLRLDMRYREGQFQEFSYAQSQWAKSPINIIYENELGVVRDLKIFKNVQIAKSKTRNDLVLEANVEDFMQYFTENDTNSFARVSITFTLIEASSHRVLASKNIKVKVNAVTLNAQGGVVSLNAALSEVLSQMAVWLQGTCK